jgi:hypothetical protein
MPCTGESCVCPWSRLADCDRGCTVDGLEIVAEADRAATQLCAPSPDAGSLARSMRAAASHGCDEEDVYVCTGGQVVSCAEHAVVGTCTRGCFAEGTTIGGAGLDEETHESPGLAAGHGTVIGREAAFAVLCSR